MNQAVEDLRTKVFGGEMAISDALDQSAVSVNFYLPISDRLTAD